MSRVLRSYIRKMILEEGIKSGRALASKGLISDAKGEDWVLFDKKLIDDLGKLASSDPDLFSSPDECAKYIVELKPPRVYGIATLSKNKGKALDASEVTYCAAEPGWGPTMYDIVMGIEPNGVMGSRESVSDDALGVWDFYSARRPDISKSMLDYKRSKYTKTTKDDALAGNDGAFFDDRGLDPEDGVNVWKQDPLSWTYNRDELPGTDKLLDTGSKLFSKIGRKWTKAKQATFIQKLNSAYFLKRYK